MIRVLKFWLALMAVWFSCACLIMEQKKITLYSIGDSTMADYDIEQLSKENGGENYPLRGWMMELSQFFNGNILIKNFAVSGRSSKSFRNEGHWKKVMDNLQPGDYVFIQFGHNDSKIDDSTRYTDPGTSFRQNIINYVKETKEKGAHPVLFTSIVRRAFDDEKKLKDTHGQYVKVVRELASEMNVPLIDLNRKTEEFVSALGPEKSKEFFLFIKPGLFAKLPNGLEDNTHLSEWGALKVAALAIDGMKELKLPIIQYLKLN